MGTKTLRQKIRRQPELVVQTAVKEFVRRFMNPRLIVDPPQDGQNQEYRGTRHLMLDIDGIRD